MAIIRWDPFMELENLHNQVNSLFNETFGSVGAGRGLVPATDIYRDDKKMTVEVHLPNFKDKEINVEQHDNELEIKAEHQEKEEDRNRKYIVRESVSQYYRRFTLPKNADSENIKANYEDGILKVTVPYKELPQPKKIAISPKNKKS